MLLLTRMIQGQAGGAWRSRGKRSVFEISTWYGRSIPRVSEAQQYLPATLLRSSLTRQYIQALSSALKRGKRHWEMSKSTPRERTPLFLLKTKSLPTDAYEELFTTLSDGYDFEPHFVPVLDHRFADGGMAKIKSVLLSRGISGEEGSPYGGLVFTSQRAVEAFTHLVRGGPANGELPRSWNPSSN